MQKQVGIDVFSDGEWRRSGWAGGFAEAMEQGYVPGTPAVRLSGQTNPIADRLGTFVPGADFPAGCKRQPAPGASSGRRWSRKAG